MKKTLLTLLAVAAGLSLQAQTITVKDTLMTTYPYSDPNPVANVGKIYPYWTFQEYSVNPVSQTWKMVVLENRYLRVKIFPEIGGKVWSVYDKTAGREMMYDNDAVKFRNIAHRGPWTSGGIEFNYGVIGHAPSCSSPVDWCTRKKADGSVSCYIGVFEMTSRSRWTVEINLPEDSVWLLTRCVWHNLSNQWQPYYSWSNSAIETDDDIILVYPANNAIGHNGEIETYPVDEQGRDLSVVGNQNFGHDKSYHMIGSQKPFFGAYFPSADWGTIHFSMRDEKVGRKYFTWSQSREGEIWVDLLTDGRRQYVELQSGRLFNQNMETSCLDTPFRQFLFTPYGTDEWNEYWLPYEGIGAADNVTLDAVTSFSGGRLGIYPLRSFDGLLTVTDKADKVLYQASVSLNPSEIWTENISGDPATVRLGKRIIWEEGDSITDRPQTRGAGYETESAGAFVLNARDFIGLGDYTNAEINVDKALALAPGNVDALSLKSAILFNRMDYSGAYDCSSRALAIDQYNPEAGYFGGLAASQLGKVYDAMDRFEVAAIGNYALRPSCYTELARLHFRRGDTELASDYARKALKYNVGNITAMMILVKAGAADTDCISATDPLNHFPAAEKFLSGEIGAEAFAASFFEEIPWEDYLELAIFYRSLGLDSDACRIIDALPQQNALTAIWRAWMADDTAAIAGALENTVDFVFPFRQESARPLEWAIAGGGGWKARYLLALIKDKFGYKEEAVSLVSGQEPDWAPFYAYRYSLTKDTADLRKAFSLEPDSWRYRRMLATDLTENGKYEEAVSLLKEFYSSHPENFQIGDALIDAYVGLGNYKDAEKIIDKIVYLPFEGQKSSHSKYSDIKLHLAAQACDKGDFKKALSLVDEALLWPERLGAGKPYDELLDTGREEWVRQEIIKKMEGKCTEPLYPRLDDCRTSDKKFFKCIPPASIYLITAGIILILLLLRFRKRS